MRRPLTALLTLALTLTLAPAQDDLRALAARYQDTLDHERWAEVIQTGERLMQARPDLATVPYNLACAHAQRADPDAAFRWLTTAVDNGYAGLASIQSDPDLDPLRADPRFEPLLARVQAARDQRFEAFTTMAREAEMIVVVPDTLPADEPAPLIVALHGHGGRAEDFVEVYREAAARIGAVLVVPSAIRPAGNGGQSWTFRDEAEWMVFYAIERASKVHAIDPARVVLTGFSMGANTTLEVGLKHPDRFVGLIPVCGHWDEGVMRLGESDRRPRVALMIGARDPWAKTFRRAHEALGEAGIRSRLRVYQGVGHGYPADATGELVEAFAFVLGEDRP